MKIILEDSKYSYVASTKVITLAAPYDSLSQGQILKIVDLTTGSVFYNANSLRYPISISGADITHTYSDENDEDADKLQITIDTLDINSTPGAGLEPFDYESVTVADSPAGLTSATYLDAKKAECTLETAQIRIRIDGTDPTSSEGHLVETGDIITLNSATDIANFKSIRTGSTSGVLKVSYFH